MYALKQARARENERAFTEKHALAVALRRALLFQISWELSGPKKKKEVLPLLYVLLLSLMLFRNQIIQQKKNQRDEKKQKCTMHDGACSNCWPF